MLKFLFGDTPNNSIIKIFYYGSILVWCISLLWGIIKIVRNLTFGVDRLGSQVIITVVSSLIYLIIIRIISKIADKNFNK